MRPAANYMYVCGVKTSDGSIALFQEKRQKRRSNVVQTSFKRRKCYKRLIWADFQQHTIGILPRAQMASFFSTVPRKNTVSHDKSVFCGKNYTCWFYRSAINTIAPFCGRVYTPASEKCVLSTTLSIPEPRLCENNRISITTKLTEYYSETESKVSLFEKNSSCIS